VLSKCANHGCSNPFLYLGLGKLFHFPRSERGESQNLRSMEAFWLCGQCSRQLTLQWRRDAGVIAVPLNREASATLRPCGAD